MDFSNLERICLVIKNLWEDTQKPMLGTHKGSFLGNPPTGRLILV